MLREPRIVGSHEIQAYWPRLEKLARRYTGRYGAEQDDLVQEGAIFVWESLQKGIRPPEEMILKRMRNWVRTMEHQTRYTRLVSYESLQEKQMEKEEALENPEWLQIMRGGLDEQPSLDE